MSKLISQPFIHIHIPKTAGTSLRATFIRKLGPRHVAFMMPDRKFVRTSDLPFDTEALDKARRAAREAGQLAVFSAQVDAVNKGKTYDAFDLTEFTARDIKLATGHLTHQDITETVANIPRTTILREPLERAWSHYAHWREARGTMWWHHGTIAYSDEVSFETFAMDPKLTNYQAHWLGSLNFKTVGVTTKLREFLEEIGLDSSLEIPTLNPGQYDMPAFDSGFLRNFREMNATDYELYEAALQHFI